MQILNNNTVYSATDLNNFLNCRYLTKLDLDCLNGELDAEPSKSDTALLLADKGDEHKRAWLKKLKAEGKEVVTIETHPGDDPAELEKATQETQEAMQRGAEVINRATFYDGLWPDTSFPGPGIRRSRAVRLSAARSSPQRQRAEIGTAVILSPKPTVDSPVYRTTPLINRSPKRFDKAFRCAVSCS